MDLDVGDVSVGRLMRGIGDTDSPLSNPSPASPRRRAGRPRRATPLVQATLLRRATTGQRRAPAGTNIEQFIHAHELAFGDSADSVELDMSGSATTRARSFLAHQRRSLSGEELATLLRKLRTPGVARSGRRRLSVGVSPRQLVELGDDGVEALLELVDDGLEEFEGTMSASGNEESTLTPSPPPETGDVREDTLVEGDDDQGTYAAGKEGGQISLDRSHQSHSRSLQTPNVQTPKARPIRRVSSASRRGTLSPGDGTRPSAGGGARPSPARRGTPSAGHIARSSAGDGPGPSPARRGTPLAGDGTRPSAADWTTPSERDLSQRSRSVRPGGTSLHPTDQDMTSVAGSAAVPSRDAPLTPASKTPLRVITPRTAGRGRTPTSVPGSGDSIRRASRGRSASTPAVGGSPSLRERSRLSRTPRKGEYREIVDPPSEDIQAADLSAGDLPAEDIQAADRPFEDLQAADLSAGDLQTAEPSAEDVQAAGDAAGNEDEQYNTDQVFGTPKLPRLSSAASRGSASRRSALATPRTRTTPRGSPKQNVFLMFERFFTGNRQGQTSTPMSEPPRRAIRATRPSLHSKSLFLAAAPPQGRTPGRLSLAVDESEAERPAPPLTSGLFDDPDEMDSDVSEEYPSETGGAAGLSPQNRSVGSGRISQLSVGSRAVGTPFIPSAESTRLSPRLASGAPPPVETAAVAGDSSDTVVIPAAATASARSPGDSSDTVVIPVAATPAAATDSRGGASASSSAQHRSLRPSSVGGTTPRREPSAPGANTSRAQTTSGPASGRRPGAHKVSAREAFARLFPNYERDQEQKREEAAAKRRQSRKANKPAKRSSLVAPHKTRRWFRQNARGLRVTPEALQEVDASMEKFERMVLGWLREVTGPHRAPTDSDVLAVLRRSGVASTQPQLRRLIRQHMMLEEQQELIRVAECGRLFPADNPLLEE